MLISKSRAPQNWHCQHSRVWKIVILNIQPLDFWDLKKKKKKRLYPFYFIKIDWYFHNYWGNNLCSHEVALWYCSQEHGPYAFPTSPGTTSRFYCCYSHTAEEHLVWYQTRKFFHLNSPSCSVEEGDWVSSWVGIWPPAKVKPPHTATGKARRRSINIHVEVEVGRWIWAPGSDLKD